MLRIEQVVANLFGCDDRLGKVGNRHWGVEQQNDKVEQLAAHGLAITQDDASESVASRGSGLNLLQTKPFTDNHRNCVHLVGRQHTKTARKFGVWNRYEILRVEDARFQKSDWNSDFEIGSPRGR